MDEYEAELKSEMAIVKARKKNRSKSPGAAAKSPGGKGAKRTGKAKKGGAGAATAKTLQT